MSKHRTHTPLGARLSNTEQERVLQMPYWNVKQLLQACSLKGISYEESGKLVNLLSVTVRFKDTYTICVRADLPEPRKVVAIAHELAHCALGHTIHPAQSQRFPSFLFVQDPEREHEARIWAAHLLVSAEVYDEEYRSALMLTQSPFKAHQDATIVTARRLGIPPETVTMWVEHRTVAFPIAPSMWLALPSV
jgi:Zn-dependent peptidase ImmA (M78 family)